MTLIEDQDVGKRGVVFVVFFDGVPDMQGAWKLPNVCRCVPLRFEATHMCYECALKSMDSVLKLMAGMFIRVRSRNHYGKKIANFV